MTLDDLYAERNAVVIAFAVMARERGWRVGRLAHRTEPEWPVLMIDTPAGQVSWHLRADEMPAWVEPYARQWDGHDTKTKYERLAALGGEHGAD